MAHSRCSWGSAVGKKGGPSLVPSCYLGLSEPKDLLDRDFNCGYILGRSTDIFTVFRRAEEPRPEGTSPIKLSNFGVGWSIYTSGLGISF